ncbi:MAG: hypothetical protein FJY83_07355 [Candidatus Aminicenantes bacterium]|nr:hypothetical protein [Candidatus Aminicenantes bacterium]
MAQIATAAVSILLSFLTTAAVDLESSFLQSRPDLLLGHLSARSRLSLSLPEPVGFSGQLTARQSFFYFQDVFGRFLTQEFYPESGLPRGVEDGPLIFKARWAFRDRRTGEQHALRLFFLFRIESPPPRTGRANPWKITEIKAEKI